MRNVQPAFSSFCVLMLCLAACGNRGGLIPSLNNRRLNDWRTWGHHSYHRHPVISTTRPWHDLIVARINDCRRRPYWVTGLSRATRPVLLFPVPLDSRQTLPGNGLQLYLTGDGKRDLADVLRPDGEYVTL